MTGQRLPFDLKAHLVRSGVIDPKGINDRPKERACRTCHLTTLVAWRDGYGQPIAVDPVTLTPLGELQALLAGRVTVDDWGDGLDVRRPHDITHRPANVGPQPVRAEHRCHAPPLDHVPARAKPSDAPDAPPPF